MARDKGLRGLGRRLRSGLARLSRLRELAARLGRRPVGVVRVRGDSMRPTLRDGQYVLTRPLGGGRPLRRGDIIVFREPGASGQCYIKRIVGLPGEFIEFERGQVWIDGQLRPELGIVAVPAGGRDFARRWHTGAGEDFVLGDNRGDSADSRRFGPVAEGLIGGRVWFWRGRGSGFPLSWE